MLKWTARFMTLGGAGNNTKTKLRKQ